MLLKWNWCWWMELELIWEVIYWNLATLDRDAIHLAAGHHTAAAAATSPATLELRLVLLPSTFTVFFVLFFYTRPRHSGFSLVSIIATNWNITLPVLFQLRNRFFFLPNCIIFMPLKSSGHFFKAELIIPSQIGGEFSDVLHRPCLNCSVSSRICRQIFAGWTRDSCCPWVLTVTEDNVG